MIDLISRQAAIDMLKNRWKKTRNYEGIGDDIAEECELYLKQVPSAQPERKKGRWIDMDDHVMCSCCGATHYGSDKNFCPNCGADMRRNE